VAVEATLGQDRGGFCVFVTTDEMIGLVRCASIVEKGCRTNVKDLPFVIEYVRMRVVVLAISSQRESGLSCDKLDEQPEQAKELVGGQLQYGSTAGFPRNPAKS
jgi:hypothetical protein